MRLKSQIRERRMHIAKVNSINFKQRSFKICVLLGLYFIFISSFSTVLGTDFPWEGIDDQDKPVTFTVTDDDMQWFNFTMILVHPGGQDMLIAPGPGGIVNGQFSGQNAAGTFSFTGQFTSPITATGTYTIINYPIVIPIDEPPYEEIRYISRFGTWNAAGILPVMPPLVFTEPASSVTEDSAVLNGTVNPNGKITDYYFEYGFNIGYGAATAPVNIGNSFFPESVNTSLFGLLQNTEYHFRLVATNADGTTYGNDMSFTTPARPLVTTGPADSITPISAVLKGTINPNGKSADYYFEYGTDTSYGMSTPAQNAGEGTTDVPVNGPITSLMENTTYHYRLVGINADGTAYGDDQSFTTLIKTFSNLRRITWNSGESNNPSIAVDYNGHVHVVWMDNLKGNFEIYYKKSTNDGATWGRLKRITYNSGVSRCPLIAIDTSNNIHILWQDDTPGNFEIFYKKSTTGGATWSLVKRLTYNSGLSINPDMAIDSNYNVYLIWQDDFLGNPEIFLKSSTNAGITWGAIRRITYNYGTTEAPAIAVDTQDNIHIGWNYSVLGNNEIYYKRSTNYGAAWTAFSRITYNGGSSQGLDIAADSKGDVHLTWQDNSPGNFEVLFRKSLDNGSTWGTLDRFTWNPGSSTSPAIAMDTWGNISVIWEDLTPGNYEIFYNDSGDSGATWKGLKRVTYNTGQSLAPAVFLYNGEIHVVWADNTFGNMEIFYKNKK